MRRCWAGAVAVAGALTCAAPAGAATEVHWESGFGNGRYAQVLARSGPGETNDLELFAEDRVPGQPESLIVRDRSAGVTTISATVTPGDCLLPADGRCEVPCQILSPSEARCALSDGFVYHEPIDERLIEENYSPVGRGARPGYVPNPETFTHISFWPGDGSDSFTTPPQAGNEAIPWMRPLDGGDTYDLGSQADVELKDGDTARLMTATPYVSGLTVKVAGAAEVFADNDRADTIQCNSNADPAKIHHDDYDHVRCGALQQDRPLPALPLNPG